MNKPPGMRVRANDLRLLQELRADSEPELFAERFVIESEIGAGGMGFVYRAYDQISKQVVALKILRNTDETSLQRFASEAALLERLEHPAIVRYVAHGSVAEGDPYLAMVWVEGESLCARLKRGPIPLSGVIELARRVAEALQVAHSHGIFHRDIKPANILLPEGRVELAMIADFGVARAYGEARITTTGFGLGTPGYAAPEQVRGTPDLDQRADLFSLGCVLFRCLTNTEAFPGTEPLTIIAKLVLEEVPSVSQFRADIPAALEELVARLLAKDRNLRPNSAHAVLQVLDELTQSPAQSLSGATLATRSRNKARQASSIAALSAACIGLTWAFWPHPCNMPTALPPLAAAQPARHILVTDLPASATCSPEAVLSYQEGLRALRGAMREIALKSFEHALELDPGCPEAWLRVSHTAQGLWPIAVQREQLQHALGFREQLSERDRVLLDSAALAITSVPSDLEGAAKILKEGSNKFPLDVELLHLTSAAYVEVVSNAAEMEPILELSQRAVQWDPAYARAWQVLGWLNARLRRPEAELSSYLQCLSTSPGAVDCMRDQVAALREQGQCQEAVHLAWQWLARDPSTYRAYRLLAASMAAQGATHATLEEVLRMRWAHMQGPGKDIVRLHEAAKLWAWSGNFTKALQTGQKLERQVAEDPHVESHARASQLLVDTLLETGQNREAAQLAENVLDRKLAWTNSVLSGDWCESGASYYEPQLLGVALEYGQLSPALWHLRSAAWEKQAVPNMNQFESWVIRWGSALGEHISASDALRVLPPSDVLPTDISFYWRIADVYAGKLYLAAGDTARALPLLRAFANSCQGLDQPFLNTRAYLWLGQAHEKQGDLQAACAAYNVVIQRWGHATPRSVTAEAAARHSRQLHCSARLREP